MNSKKIKKYLQTMYLRLNLATMKKIINFVFLFGVVFGQISVSDLNRELDIIKKGLEIDDIDDVVEEEILKDSPMSSVTLESYKVESDKIDDYFGYSYFKKDINFFDNAPTPTDFKLGPGDEIIISLWGENNKRENFVINKNGQIYYENVGFISLSNKTLYEAEDILKKSLSKIYETLDNKINSTKLAVEIGRLKSINVYFSGEIENPGINLIHPFSDIFSAIVQAGGIKNEGSLRNIEIIRSGKKIAIVDFYSFFIDGESNFSNLRLVDGDIIHVPIVKKRVKIAGNILKPKNYELQPNEFLEHLIQFSGGFTPDASSLIVLDRIIPISERSSDDNATTSMNIDYKNSSLISLENGDIIKIKPIGLSQSKARVFGKVKNPGEYSAMNSSLKDILDFAGGFNDPLFRKSIDDDIIILRLDENQFYAQEYKVKYKDSAAFIINPGDKIFVYENSNYNKSFTFRFEGEVNRPGRYPFQKGITVKDAIATAGGLTEISNLSNIVILQEFSEVDDDGNIIITTNSVANASLDFEIANNTLLKALPVENVINVSGNVYNPGLISFTPGITMYDAIEMAGGHKPYSLKKRAYVIRANGEREKANLFRGRAKRIFPGDTVYVPVNPEPSDFDITAFIADLSTTLANIAAILILVDNNSN